MVDETKVTEIIGILNEFHGNTGDIRLLNFYSKLSLLELCGWLETTMDDMVNSFASRQLTHKDYLEEWKETVSYNNGFSYDRHFKKMICKLIGLSLMEKIEIKWQIQIIKFRADLKYW